jgi:hypothetical protein
MERGIKTVRYHKGILHVETDEGIVNIYVGLHDKLGRNVTTVECLPDNYAGEARVRCSPCSRIRMIRNRRPARRRAT